MKQKLISIVLALSMAISLLPAAGFAALAAGEKAENGGHADSAASMESAQPAATYVTVDGYTVAVPQKPVGLSAPDGDITVTAISGTQSTLSLTDGWYAVEGAVSVTERITVTGEVNLILTDGCQLNAARGIDVPEGNSLTVWSESLGEQMGAITVPEDSEQTIGGRHGINKYDTGKRVQQSAKAGGTIIINGGAVSAPAIGGGNGASLAIRNGDKEECLLPTSGGDGGIVTVNAGHVKTGRIGGGEGGASDRTVGSGPNAESLRAGDGGAGGSITVNGGTVEIARHSNGNTVDLPGWIGGGNGGIRSGYVPQRPEPDVRAGTGGAGDSITIAGGAVKVYGTIGGGAGGQGFDNAAYDGIGGAGGTIAITGGTVNVTGHIGGGPSGINRSGDNNASGGDGGSILIRGGQVSVSSRDRIVAIGSPYTNQKNKGTFSTGADGTGNAVIFIRDPSGVGISDQSDMGQWSGAIFQENGGILYGSPVFSHSFTIPKGYSLHIFKGHTLQAEAGVAIRNEGIISNFGAISDSIKLEGNGEVYDRPESVPCYNPGTDPEAGKVETKPGTDMTSYIAGTLCDLGSNSSTSWYAVRGGTAEEPILCERRITIHGDVHIVLENESHISVPKGITVPGDASLTIWAESADRSQAGHLTAGAPNGMDTYASGIGSNHDSTGAITINGGVIRAHGGECAAAIGGYLKNLLHGSDGTTGPIRIINSTVYAHEGGQKVGIGGDYDSAACELMIRDSEVHAGGTECGLMAPENQMQAKQGSLIYSSSPVPSSDRSGWECILFEGARGKIYGNPVISYDIGIPRGATLEIGGQWDPALRGGAKIRNNGTIVLLGTLAPEVQFEPEGVIYTPESSFSYYDPAKQSIETHPWGNNTFFLTEDLKTLGRDGAETWYTAGLRLEGQQSLNPNRVELHGNVNIVLRDGCDWNFPKGITVGRGNTLTVWAESKDPHRMCRLSAGGGDMPDHSAGIGGVFSYKTWRQGEVPDGVDRDAATCGTVNLFGGRIMARGRGKYGTGIGAAFFGDGGTVTIRDSHVTATASDKGAGIGGTYEMIEKSENGWTEIEYIKLPDGTLHIYDDAAVFASSKTGAGLSDRTDSEAWQGLICENGNGLLYQQSRITKDAFIPGDCAIRIHEGDEVSIEEGILIHNEGVIINEGTIKPENRVTGSGQIVTTQHHVPYYDPLDKTVKYTPDDKPVNSLHQISQSIGTVGEETWYIMVGGRGNSWVLNRNRVEVRGDVNLIFADGCHMNITQGIEVADGNSLTIWQQSADTGEAGKLSVGQGDGLYQIPDNAAAIGGNWKKSGPITINGGKLRIHSKYYGAAIGGGRDSSAGPITVNGGDIDANARGSGACIGGGSGGGMTKVTVNGGRVYTERTHGEGACIGGGNAGGGGEIVINGGHVTALGQSTAGGITRERSAIGGGRGGSGCKFTMTGGLLEAYNPNDFIIQNTGNPTITGGAVLKLFGERKFASPGGEEDWQGIVFKSDSSFKNAYSSGKIYGEPTLRQSFCLTRAKLTIAEGQTLKIAPGVSFTLGEEGSVDNRGTVAYDAGTDLSMIGDFGGRVTVGKAVFGGDIRTLGLNLTVSPKEETIYYVGSADGSKAVFTPAANVKNAQLELTNVTLNTGSQPALTLGKDIDLVLTGCNTVKSQNTALTAPGGNGIRSDGTGSLRLIGTVSVPDDTDVRGAALRVDGPMNGTFQLYDSGVLHVDSGKITVSGEYTLPEDLTVERGEELTVGNSADQTALTVPEGMTLIVESGGTVRNLFGAEIVNNGSIKNAGDIWNEGTIPADITNQGGGIVHQIRTINAAGGTVSIANTKRTDAAFAGEQVTLIPDAAPAGKLLIGWQVLPAAVKIENNQFTMPDENVTVKAVYADRTYTLSVTAPSFDDMIYGDAQSAAKPITIKSSGNSDTTITKVESSSTDFAITAGDKNITAGGSNEGWTARPAADLAAGTHTATITVTYQAGDQTAAVAAAVSLTVIPKSITPAIGNEVSFIYTGAAFSPAVSVKDGNTDIPADEYAVTYLKKDSEGRWHSCEKPVYAGTYKIMVSDAKAETGNTGNYTLEEAFREFIILDKTAPVIGAVKGNPATWQKTDAELTFSAEDTGGTDLSSVTVIGGSYEKETALKEKDGIYTIIAKENGTYTITATDGAGNKSTQTVSVTGIDKTAPAVTGVTGNAADWTHDNVTLKVEGAADSLSGLAEKPYSFDGGRIWQAENSKTFEENTADIQIQVRDAVGNVQELSPLSVTRIDKTDPVISTISSNPAAWQNTDAALTFTIEEEGSGVQSVTVSGGSYERETVLTAKNGVYTVIAAQNGTYTVTAADGAGNKDTQSVTVAKIDKAVPQISAVSGNPAAWRNTDAALTFSVAETGGSGVQSVTVSGGSYEKETVLTAKDGVYTVIAAENGTYTVTVTDGAGSRDMQSVTVTKIDKTAPTITGVKNGAVYHAVQTVTAADPQLKEVTLNGVVQEIPFLLPGVKEETECTIFASDEAGNKTAVTVTMKPSADVSGPVEESGLGEAVSVGRNTDGDYIIHSGAQTPPIIAKETVNRIISEHALADVSVVAEPFLQVEIIGSKAGGDAAVTEITYDITPFVNVRLQGTGFTQILSSFAMENVTKPVTITLTLPDGFNVPDGHKIQVVHTKSDGTKYTYDVTRDGNQITFENPHGFSTFTVQTSPVSAKTGDEGHVTLWGGLAMAAACSAAYVVLNQRKKKERDQ